MRSEGCVRSVATFMLTFGGEIMRVTKRTHKPEDGWLHLHFILARSSTLPEDDLKKIVCYKSSPDDYDIAEAFQVGVHLYAVIRPKNYTPTQPV